MPETLVIPASLEAVSQFTQALEGRLHALSLKLRTSLVLAIQELGVNIVRHAYAGAPGQIEITLDHTADHLHVHVVDDAPTAFTMPGEISTPDAALLPEHGLGLFIIHQAFDRVTYHRSGDQNIWDLVKALQENE